MNKLLIIRGEGSSGKTTTAGMVYQALLPLANKSHIFNGKTVTQDSLYIDKEGETSDFTATLTINGKIVVIISAGDEAIKLQAAITATIHFDVLICCARSLDRKGSSYRMLSTNYANDIEGEVWTKHAATVSDKYAVKESVVKDIVARVQKLV